MPVILDVSDTGNSGTNNEFHNNDALLRIVNSMSRQYLLSDFYAPSSNPPAAMNLLLCLQRQIMWVRLCAFFWAVSGPLALGDTVYQWTNLAGQPYGQGSDDGIGSSASFRGPTRIAVDGTGKPRTYGAVPKDYGQIKR
jgi:hypothetical protein